MFYTQLSSLYKEKKVVTISGKDRCNLQVHGDLDHCWQGKY